MTPTYDDSPEVAGGHDLPEAYISQPPEQVWSPQPSIAPTYASHTPVGYGNNGQYTDAVKPGSAGGTVGGVAATDAGAYTAPESTIQEKKTGAATVGGISLVVILSIIIAILSAAVIGLAAGTGVATNNYNNANSKVKALSASLAAAQASPVQTGGTPTSSGSSSSSGSPTSTDWNNITNGCSDNAAAVNGLIYTSLSFGSANFTMFCNKDTINNPLYSLYAPDFNGCMDACAGWNTYNKTTDGTCIAVSFIPEWSVVATALQGKAPGDCYLKPGPIVKANLTNPNIGGGEVHAAILIKQ
ncbi:hypothetical protein ACHAQJ_000409 [Trichoderma viride]